MCLLGAPLPKSRYVGSEIHGKENLVHLRYPVSGNQVNNWDDVELMWQHIFSELLKIEPDEHPLLVTAPVTGRTEKDNDTLAILLFETFIAPRAFVASPAVLSLYASGRSTGLVVDSGHNQTTCVPVYEGFPLASATHTLRLGGGEVTEHLGSILSQPGLDQSVMKEVKERFCHVALDPYRECVRGEKGWETQRYTLPDGKVVSIGTEAFRAPEPLFAPFLGLPNTVQRVIGAADRDVRERLWGDIVLTGGNTLLPGFAERLGQDVKPMVPHGVKMGMSTVVDPRTAAWRGGSMLSSLSTFRDMCIPYKEYDEYGPVLLRRKCLGVSL
ncbi:actin 3 [Cercophora newfieldiana]|uniref:Actin 3 n=1 Tax=Cercophora newfieldiana TaxID=92897 RepID=A0AA40CIM4_9PEZI|nr:actin 3 [Cercophora newfieldiana]